MESISFWSSANCVSKLFVVAVVAASVVVLVVESVNAFTASSWAVTSAAFVSASACFATATSTGVFTVTVNTADEVWPAVSETV